MKGRDKNGKIIFKKGSDINYNSSNDDRDIFSGGRAIYYGYRF